MLLDSPRLTNNPLSKLKRTRAPPLMFPISPVAPVQVRLLIFHWEQTNKDTVRAPTLLPPLGVRAQYRQAIYLKTLSKLARIQ